jgi:hypothetical protein
LWATLREEASLSIFLSAFTSPQAFFRGAGDFSPENLPSKPLLKAERKIESFMGRQFRKKSCDQRV